MGGRGNRDNSQLPGRRAWSVALFEAMQELYFNNTLGGVCHWRSGAAWGGCVFVTSDSYLSQHNGRQYLVRIDDEMTRHFPTDVSSEEWYQAWWTVLLKGQIFSHSGSKQGATLAGEDACKRYLAALEKDPTSRLGPDLMPMPSCSLLFATDSSLYVVVDFRDLWSPALVDYTNALLRVFGQAFSSLPYQGSVIFRSPWKTLDDGSKTLRVFRIYELDRISFLWDESFSGVRSEADAGIDLVGSSTPGQTELHSYTEGSGGGAIVRMTSTKDGRTLIDLTNGATWSVPNADLATCSPHVGDDTFVIPSKKVTILAFYGTLKCGLSATFAGAW